MASIFSWRTPIGSAIGVSSSLRSISPPIWKRLPFAMQHQSQSSWCWAATAASVADYFKPAPGWAQCQVAEKVIGGSCCNQPSPCNQSSYLDLALSAVGHFVPPVKSPISIAAIDSDISRSRPVPIRIGWSGGGGHFIVFSGVSLGPQVYIGIDDPLFGSSDVPLQTLAGSYQGSGSWTNTYPVR
jgi:hypothetical protein